MCDRNENKISLFIPITHTKQKERVKYERVGRTTTTNNNNTMASPTKRSNEASDAEPSAKREKKTECLAGVTVYTVRGTKLPGCWDNNDADGWRKDGLFSPSDATTDPTMLSSYGVVDIYTGISRDRAFFAFLRAFAYCTTNHTNKQKKVHGATTIESLRDVVDAPLGMDDDWYEETVKKLRIVLHKGDNMHDDDMRGLQKDLAALRGEDAHPSLVYRRHDL
jgi:hypothetical protein